MRLIDADALIPMMKYATTDNEIGIFPIRIGFDEIVKVIDEQPTIEPVRMKGRWENDSYGAMDDGEYLVTRCSVCGTAYEYGHDDRYCGFCGAEMSEGEEDD